MQTIAVRIVNGVDNKPGKVVSTAWTVLSALHCNQLKIKA
jgi:hypothetical protein